MRPILLQGHQRPLTQVKFNKEGDVLFSAAKDNIVNIWFSDNGERFGALVGHQGAVWSVDSDPYTRVVASGSADNTMRLWEYETGKQLKLWEFPTAIKRVEFCEDGRNLLCLQEKRSGHLSTMYVYEVDTTTATSEQPDEPRLTIVVTDLARVTVCGQSFLNHWIMSGHEDGTVAKWDARSGELLSTIQPHTAAITDLQWSHDRLFFVTASKDKSAKMIKTRAFEAWGSYETDTPLNSAAVTPGAPNFVILGGGQAAMDVTTTSARQGKFEARFWSLIFQEEVGRVRGHFGPLNYVHVSPTGKCYASGSEDGYVRLHHFDPSYFEFKFDVEREHTQSRLA